MCVRALLHCLGEWDGTKGGQDVYLSSAWMPVCRAPSCGWAPSLSMPSALRGRRAALYTPSLQLAGPSCCTCRVDDEAGRVVAGACVRENKEFSMYGRLLQGAHNLFSRQVFSP